MKIKMKSGVFLTILIVLCLVITGCGSGARSNNGVMADSEGKKYVIKIANNFGLDHPHNIALKEKFIPIVEEKSGGTIEVEIYENNQLGGELESFDGVRNGTIEMAIAGTTVSGNPEKINVGNWPFLFTDLEHAKRAYTGEIGAEIAAELKEKTGVHVLGWTANGFRAISSNKSLNNMEDFKDMRLRMPNLPDYIEMGKLLGANVVALPFSEIFTALEQNVADGQDNPISTLRANGYYEVQDFVLESNHVFSPNMYVINAKLWDGFSGHQREAIEEAASQSTEYQWELYANSLETDKKFLKENGIEFITPDEEFRQNMIEAMDPFYEETYAKFPWAEELVNRIKELQ